jgi:hypothetical protein
MSQGIYAPGVTNARAIGGQTVNGKNALNVALVGNTSSGSGFAIQGNGYIAKPTGSAGADAVTAYAAATQITVTGLSFLFSKNDVDYIVQIPTSGDATTYTDKADFTVTGAASPQTITVAGAAFSATDTFIVGISGARIAYDTTDVIKVGETNHPDFHFNEDILVNVANAGAATYYYELIPGNRNGQLSFDIGVSGGVTVTIEASNDSGAAPTYRDITYAGANMMYNGAGVALNASSYVDTNALLMYPGLAVYRVRVKVVCADATNAVFIASKITSI